MDVPARNAFVNLVVEQDERSAAGGLTNLARSLGLSLAPLFVGYLARNPHSFNFELPFIIAGALKCVYDIILYVAMKMTDATSLDVGKEHERKPHDGPSRFHVIARAVHATSAFASHHHSTSPTADESTHLLAVSDSRRSPALAATSTPPLHPPAPALALDHKHDNAALHSLKRIAHTLAHDADARSHTEHVLHIATSTTSSSSSASRTGSSSSSAPPSASSSRTSASPSSSVPPLHPPSSSPALNPSSSPALASTPVTTVEDSYTHPFVISVDSRPITPSITEIVQVQSRPQELVKDDGSNPSAPRSPSANQAPSSASMRQLDQGEPRSFSQENDLARSASSSPSI